MRRGSLGHMQAASEKLQRNTARISDEQHLTELATLASAAAQVRVRAAHAVLTLSKGPYPQLPALQLQCAFSIGLLPCMLPISSPMQCRSRRLTSRLLTLLMLQDSGGSGREAVCSPGGDQPGAACIP